MKCFLLSYFIMFYSLSVNSQLVNMQCDSVKAVPVKVYFKGYTYKYEQEGVEVFRMDRSDFKNAICLALTDSSYDILSYNVVADLNEGSLISINSSKALLTNDSKFYKEFISGITKNSLITVDKIYVRKNNQCFRLPSFMCYFIN